MLESLIIVLTLCSGSFLGAAKFHKRFEEVLPISSMSLICVLFLFGLAGLLKYGILFSFLIIIAVYLYAFASLVKGNSFKEKILCFCRDFFTPAFFIFACYFLILNICDFGMLATTFDDFTCWLDRVKIMSYLDDFTTNPASHAGYASYPPAMALYQYFFQKIYQWFNPELPFNEWRMILAYQLLSLSLFFPFLKPLSHKKPLCTIIAGLILPILPLLFYSYFLYSLYIDAFLGIAAGCGFTMLLLREKPDVLDSIYLCLLCAILVLSKDVGMYFACFIAFGFVIKCFLPSCTGIQAETRKTRFTIMVPFLPALCAVLAKLLWSFEVSSSGVSKSFGKKIDIGNYIFMFFFRNDPTYHQNVVDSFRDAFFTKTISVGTAYVSYFTLICVILLSLYFLQKALQAHDPKRAKQIAFLVGLTCVQAVGYLFFLGATYVSNFSQSEALELASFERYCNIPLLSCWVVLIISVLTLIINCEDTSKQKMFILSLAVFIFAVSPMERFSNFLDRDQARDTMYIRGQYAPLADKINACCDSQDRIYFISQGGNGYDYYVTQYNIRPNSISSPCGYSLGQPLYDGDVWTRDVSVREWRDELFSNFDYVAISKVEDTFIKNYGALFANPEEIADQTLFFIDQETGLLKKCS